MSAVSPEYELQPEDRPNPVVWYRRTRLTGHAVDVSDEVMRAHFGDGKGKKIKSFGHDPGGVHFLLTRDGTIVHTDKAYTRFTHQLVLRNDGNRLRGLARYDGGEHTWHPPLVVGSMYCLDTHSPHQGLKDPRMNPGPPPIYKAVIAVDRDAPLPPSDAWLLLQRLLTDQLSDWDTTDRPIRPSRRKGA